MRQRVVSFALTILAPYRRIRRSRRKKKLLHGSDPALSVGLEIGPLASPIVTKSEGPVFYADVAPREALMECHKEVPFIDVKKIAPVDFVWSGKSLRETIPADLAFDYVIACHVIEHSFDPIGWLREVAKVTKPGGILSLAVPDKRYMYDRERRLTTLDELLSAPRDLDREQAKKGDLFWYHKNVFTAESFAEIITALHATKAIPFKLVALYPRIVFSHEFIAILKHGASPDT